MFLDICKYIIVTFFQNYAYFKINLIEVFLIRLYLITIKLILHFLVTAELLCLSIMKRLLTLGLSKYRSSTL